jgi:hypothetical protein
MELLSWLVFELGLLLWSHRSNAIFHSSTLGRTWVVASMHPRARRALDMTLPIASGSLFLDIYILIIPIVATSGLQLTTTRRWPVIVVFGTGIMLVNFQDSPEHELILWTGHA